MEGSLPPKVSREKMVHVHQPGKRLHNFPSLSTVPLPSSQPTASNPLQRAGKMPQEMAPMLGWETLGPSADGTPRNPELAKPTCSNRLPSFTCAYRSPVKTSAAKCIFLLKSKKKEDFLVSNPVVSAFPMGSVNHFLLADRNNFSFRNGTFMFCGFSVYTHFATLCQHLLMNKYITG